jgi:hypothetical protein
MSSGHVELVTRFRGRDYEEWRAMVEAHEPARVRHGAVGHWIGRSIGDPQKYIGVVEFTSLGGASAYAMDIDRLEVEQAAMVEGGPHDRIWEEEIYETVDTTTYRQ